MKRPPRSFVVEVRRQKRPSGEVASSWTEEALKSNRMKADGPRVPAEPSPVRVPVAPSEPAPAGVPAASSEPPRPTGRILPSLIETQAPARAPAAAAEKAKPTKTRAPRRRGRPPAPAVAPASTAFMFPEPKPTAPPKPAAEPSTETARTRDLARHRRILARYVFGGSLKSGARWKRRPRSDSR